MVQSDKQIINKAGAIIFNSPSFDRVVLLYRAKQNDWSFPKGHIDGAESPIDAMEREVKEETGLAGKVVATLPNLEYKNSKGDKISVFMYLLVAMGDAVFQPEHHVDEVKWVDKKEVVSTLTHSNLKEYFVNNLPHIENLINIFSKKSSAQ